MFHKSFAICIISFFAFSVSAHAGITSEEARKVVDYYYHGKGGGGVFMKADYCKEIEKEGPNKNNCSDKAGQKNFALNDEIYAWGSFLVPKGDEDTFYVEFKNMGITWQTSPLKVKEGFRYRTWTKQKLDKKGVWTITFKKIDEKKGESIVLKEFQVKVR